MDVNVNARGHVEILVIHTDGTLDLVEVEGVHAQALADEPDVAICMTSSGHGYGRQGFSLNELTPEAKTAIAWFADFAMANVQLGQMAAAKMMHGDRMRPVEDATYEGGQYL
jgi:hypothetical protein